MSHCNEVSIVRLYATMKGSRFGAECLNFPGVLKARWATWRQVAPTARRTHFWRDLLRNIQSYHYTLHKPAPSMVRKDEPAISMRRPSVTASPESERPSSLPGCRFVCHRSRLRRKSTLGQGRLQQVSHLFFLEASVLESLLYRLRQR